MKYKVVEAYSLEELVSEVSHSMQHGWHACGGIAVTKDYYYQAMTKVMRV